MVVVVGVVLLTPLLLVACRPVAVPYLQLLLPPSPAAGAAAGAAAAVKVHSHWLQPAPCIAVLVAGSWWHSCVAHSRGGNQERSEYRERRRTSMNSAPVQEGGSCEFASLVRKLSPLSAVCSTQERRTELASKFSHFPSYFIFQISRNKTNIKQKGGRQDEYNFSFSLFL